MRRFILYTLFILGALTGSAQKWQTDSMLGAPFQMRTVTLPDDYSGPQRCTLIRLLSPEARETRRGVLYVHGFNDYFFQAEMADSFAARGYDFYAVDLHRYGRSLLPGQHHCDVRDLGQYSADIDSALMAMQRDGIRHIILMGHSTGGLISSYYMSRHPQAPVEALVLNSPFLDWNMGKLEPFIPFISAVGAILPDIKVSSGDGQAYGCSLRADCHGEWDYDEHLKTNPSPKVSLGWIRAIHKAQVYLRKHPRSIKVPVLLMYSAESYNGSDWTPDASKADAVLDVNDISRYGRTLSDDVCSMKVVGGLHDLSLSSPGVRKAWYKAMFKWLGSLNDNNHQSNTNSTMLKIGDKIPEKLGVDIEGHDVLASDFEGSSLIIYFYPKDNTPGCTAEACSIRDEYAELKALGYKVIGISKDSAASHQKFAAKHALPFILLSDESTEVNQAFGVWQKKKMAGREYMGTVRTTFITYPGHHISHIITKVDTKNAAKQLLDIIKGEQ